MLCKSKEDSRQRPDTNGGASEKPNQTRTCVRGLNLLILHEDPPPPFCPQESSWPSTTTNARRLCVVIGFLIPPKPSVGIMQTAQYWKPGENQPQDDGSGGPDRPQRKRGERGSGNSSTAGEGKKGDRRGDHVEQHSNSSDGKRGGSAKKRGKKSKGKDAENSSNSSSSAIGIAAEVSRSAAKPPVAGPSQGLLAMKVCAGRFCTLVVPW